MRTCPPCCHICGETIDPKALSTLTVKQKKPGGTLYMHDECFLHEQLDQKKEAAEE